MHAITLVGCRTACSDAAVRHTGVMMADFAHSCSLTLSALGVGVEGIDDTGAQNCVAFGDDGLVYRFPRYEPHRVGEVAQRHQRAKDLGLPAPGVVSVRDGAHAKAHVVLERSPGIPLQQLLPHLSASQRTRAAHGIAELLLRMRGTTRTEWPFPAPQWTDLWQGFADCAEAAAAARDSVDPAELELARAAAATAASAPVGLVHGDLAWGNILFAPDGALLAILDWDFAVVGDPAVDVAAVLMNIPEDMVAAFHATHRDADGDLRRFDSYLATWDLQHRLGFMPRPSDASGDAAGAELHADARPGCIPGLGDAVVPGALAGSTHHQ